MTPPTLIGPLLQFFFTDYLIAQRRVSPQTIASYRDTFRLLLQFVDHETGIGPTALPMASLDAGIILRFLDGLEKNRGNSVVSRNLRLTAIRSFYRMVAFRDPASTGVATHVLAIPLKRADTQVRPYLTRDEMEAILASINRTQWRGRRDYALLLSLYNTGARVSEIAALQRNQVSIASKSYVQLYGKGHKERVVPLCPRTARILKEWFRELGPPATERRVPQHSRRTADALRYTPAASQDGRTSEDFLHQQGRARPAEWIKHQISRLREALDYWLQGWNWLLSRVQLVA
jgi:site-specific recombinase XerD